MKRVVVVILVAAFVVAVAAPMIADAQQVERITWSELKCRYNPRCK